MPNYNTLLQLPDRITVLIQGICAALLVGILQFIDRNWAVNLQVIITISPFVSVTLTYFLLKMYQDKYIMKALNKRIMVVEAIFKPRFDNLNKLEEKLQEKLGSCSDRLKAVSYTHLTLPTILLV